MSKKLLKYFKGKQVQIAVEGILTSGKIYDVDDKYLFIGDDTGVKMAVPINPTPVVVDGDIDLSNDLEGMLREVANDKKKGGPLQ